MINKENLDNKIREVEIGLSRYFIEKEEFEKKLADYAKDTPVDTRDSIDEVRRQIIESELMTAKVKNVLGESNQFMDQLANVQAQQAELRKLSEEYKNQLASNGTFETFYNTLSKRKLLFLLPRNING